MTRYVTHVEISFDAEGQAEANHIADGIVSQIKSEIEASYLARNAETQHNYNPGEHAFPYKPETDG